MVDAGILRTLGRSSDDVKDVKFEDALIERAMRVFLRQMNAELAPLEKRLAELERKLEAAKMQRALEVSERR